MPTIKQFRGNYDSRYLKLDGSNANQNIDIGDYDILVNNLIAGGDVTANNGTFSGTVTADSFVGDGIVPTGSINAFGGILAPAGWLLCNGTQVSRVTYNDLFTIIGTNYGAGDGATTFHLPDLRGQFLRGRDAGAGVDPDAATRIALNAGGNVGDNVGSAQADASALPTVAFTTGNESVTHTHDHNHGAIASGNQSASHTHNTVMGAHNHGVRAQVIGGSGAVRWAHNPAGGVAWYTESYDLGTKTSGNQSASHTHSTTIPNITSGNASVSHTHTITAGGDAETRPINVYVNFIIKF